MGIPEMDARYRWDVVAKPKEPWVCLALNVLGILAEVAAGFGIVEAWTLPQTARDDYLEIAATALLIPAGFLFFGMAIVIERLNELVFHARVRAEAHQGHIPKVPSEIA